MFHFQSAVGATGTINDILWNCRTFFLFWYNHFFRRPSLTNRSRRKVVWYLRSFPVVQVWLVSWNIFRILQTTYKNEYWLLPRLLGSSALQFVKENTRKTELRNSMTAAGFHDKKQSKLIFQAEHGMVHK